MKKSPAIAKALRRFYDRNAANDQAAYAAIVSGNEAATVIGSSAREWFEGAAEVRRAYGAEGVTIDAGNIRAYENGPTGWAINTPTFTFPDGKTKMRLRMTAIFVKEGDAWKLIHIHGSTPVPDEVFLEHQAEWWPAE